MNVPVQQPNYYIDPNLNSNQNNDQTNFNSTTNSIDDLEARLNALKKS